MLYLQGGAILPVGLPIKHVGEASLEDDLSLIIALNENGIYLLIFLGSDIGDIIKCLCHMWLNGEENKI